jgi:myo-inositol-1(or 4)-monophosphatase
MAGIDDTSMDAGAILALFGSICDETAAILDVTTDWGPSGRRDGQYGVDLVADDACVAPLLAAGYSVLSEESGLQHPVGGPSALGVVVVDPLDGSTNASLGLPWCATSLCLVGHDEESGVVLPLVSMVANLRTNTRYHAVRGGGAFVDHRPVTVGEPVDLGDAIVAISGLPERHYGWRQFRSMGASALDLCAVAAGSFDAFVDMSPDAHGVWDYAGAALVVEEAGGVVVDAHGRELLVLDPAERRTPVAASGASLLEALLDLRG